MVAVTRVGFGPQGPLRRTYLLCTLADGSEWCVPSLCTGPNPPKCDNASNLSEKLGPGWPHLGGAAAAPATCIVPNALLTAHLSYREIEVLGLKPRGVFLLSIPALLEVLRRTPVVKQLWDIVRAPQNAFTTIAELTAVLAGLGGPAPAIIDPIDAHVRPSVPCNCRGPVAKRRLWVPRGAIGLGLWGFSRI